MGGDIFGRNSFSMSRFFVMQRVSPRHVSILLILSKLDSIDWHFIMITFICIGVPVMKAIIMLKTGIW